MMKKLLSFVLTAALAVSMLAGCAGTGTEAPATTVPAVSVEGTMEELLNQIAAENPVEFMGGVINLDLTDTSEDGLWALKSYTGLDSADSIVEAAAFEPMMGSIAFSMVAVRTAEGVGGKSVAEAMKAGIDTRKWICVEANEVMAAGYGDVVLFIMLDNTSGMNAQSFVDAFAKVVGSQPEFTV